MNKETKKNQQLTKYQPTERELHMVKYKSRKEKRGRPRKWMPGDRVRLQTTITPETHQFLHRLAGEKRCCTGEIIDSILNIIRGKVS